MMVKRILNWIKTMAKQTLSQLKHYFRRGAYPTAEEFAGLIDSFVHKDDEIELEKIKGLANTLNAKYSNISGKTLELKHTALQKEVNDIKNKILSLEGLASIVASSANEMVSVASDENKGKIIYLTTAGIDVYVFTHPDGEAYGRCYAFAGDVESGEDFALWADSNLQTPFVDGIGRVAFGYFEESGEFYLYYENRDNRVLYTYNPDENIRYEKGLYVVTGEFAVESIITEADFDRWNAGVGKEVDLTPYAKKSMLSRLENVASAKVDKASDMIGLATNESIGKLIYLYETSIDVYVFTHPDGEAYGRCYAMADAVESGEHFALYADSGIQTPFENNEGQVAFGYFDGSVTVYVYFGSLANAMMYGYNPDDNIRYEKGLYVVTGELSVEPVITGTETQNNSVQKVNGVSPTNGEVEITGDDINATIIAADPYDGEYEVTEVLSELLGYLVSAINIFSWIIENEIHPLFGMLEPFTLTIDVEDGINSYQYDDIKGFDYDIVRDAFSADVSQNFHIEYESGKVARNVNTFLDGDDMTIKFSVFNIGDDNIVTMSFYELKFTPTEYTTNVVHKTIA